MARTITATEAKNRLGSVMRRVQSDGEPVIVESRGEPAVVISSFQDFEELQRFREEQRRQEAIAKLRELKRKLDSQLPPMSDEEVDRIADEITREAIDNLAKKGKIRFADQ
jgi:prevent-host-death family protein